jgi:hypothetical protein
MQIAIFPDVFQIRFQVSLSRSAYPDHPRPFRNSRLPFRKYSPPKVKKYVN